MSQDNHNSIRVTVLGSGTCVPSLSRSSCSIRMQVAGRQLVFDSGPGTMRRLLEAGTRVHEVDYLFYSHFHPDHTSELVPFLFANKYPESIRRRPLTIIGGPGLEDFIAGLESIYGRWIQLDEGIVQFIELSDGRLSALAREGFTVKSAPVEHNPESRAFRIETPSGASVVYSGDTDYSRRLVELAEKTGMLICECSVPDEKRVPGHLTPSLAGRIASEAKVSQLMLTHFYPACEGVDITAQCRKTFQGPLILAEDLMTVEVD